MAYVYTLEVLTPLHVGSGQKILPQEFVCDVGNNEVCIIDMEAFFRANSANLPTLIKKIEERGFNLNREYGDLAKKHAVYRLKGDRGTIRSLSARVNYGSTYIFSFMKEAGNFYIPGSSLKGALRSFATKAVLRRNGQLGQKYGQSIAMELAGSRPRREWLSSKAERDLFGSPHSSSFRFLKLSDSDYVKPDKMQVSETRVLNICDGKVKWMSSPGNNTVEINKATPSFLETVLPGTKIAGTFSLVEPSQFRLKLGQIRMPDVLSNFLELIKETAAELLIHEEEFYRKYHLNNLAQKCCELSNIQESLKEDEVIFPMSWGTGYLTKTVTSEMPVSTQARVKKYILGSRYHETILFPKTRRVIFKDNAPVDIPGWVKLSVDKNK